MSIDLQGVILCISMKMSKSFIRAEQLRKKAYKDLRLEYDEDKVSLKWYMLDIPDIHRDYGLTDDTYPIKEEVNG